MANPLISLDQMETHLNDPEWVIIDCRFDLKRPQWGFEDFALAHIPNAQYAHLDHDLAGPITPESGRHPLPQAEHFAKKLSTWGISPEKKVVIYDTNGNSIAARLWYLLRAGGYAQAFVADGDFNLWRKENRPLETGAGFHRPGIPNTFHFQPEAFITTEEMQKLYEDPSYLILDARSPERYRGELEPIDSVAGHIPGALNRFHANNLQVDGRFKSQAQLRSEFMDLIGNHAQNKIIVYCGSGVTSCHHLIALEIVGISGARLYPGSWSEWIRDPHRKIEIGG
jgi:thiosulfate/3-mercaptopyruvate sulfurtransferase